MSVLAGDADSRYLAANLVAPFPNGFNSRVSIGWTERLKLQKSQGSGSLLVLADKRKPVFCKLDPAMTHCLPHQTRRKGQAVLITPSIPERKWFFNYTAQAHTHWPLSGQTNNITAVPRSLSVQPHRRGGGRHAHTHKHAQMYLSNMANISKWRDKYVHDNSLSRSLTHTTDTQTLSLSCLSVFHTHTHTHTHTYRYTYTYTHTHHTHTHREYPFPFHPAFDEMGLSKSPSLCSWLCQTQTGCSHAVQCVDGRPPAHWKGGETELLKWLTAILYVKSPSSWTIPTFFFSY